MPLIVAVDITRAADGEVHRVELDADARADQEGVRYWWVEGNGACDCNRHLLFERAAGREPPADERGCSTGLYTAALVHDDGELEPATPWPP